MVYATMFFCCVLFFSLGLVLVGVGMAKWRIKKQSGDVGLMSRTLKVSEVLAQILLNRGLRTKNSAIRFLNPDLKFLHDSFLMKDLEKGIQILVSGLQSGKKMAIYGDYDVDGVTSTVILFKLLTRFGADVSYYIPNREEEGYGLNVSAVAELAENGVDIIICCDNGIAAFQEITEIKKLGMKVVVLDHHEPGFVIGENGEKEDLIPPADAVIDAKQKSCAYPFKMLCTGGLAYKFAKAFHFYLDVPMSFDEEQEYLVFAAIATFCDIVDLQDENRILAKNGLDALNENKQINLGLYELMNKKDCLDKTIDNFTVGFVIGPCINACGRLESADLSVDLFLTEEAAKAQTLAARLVELNDERKNLTAKSVESAIAMMAEKEKPDPVILIYDENIHESIAGIVAGRMKEALYHPVIVLTRSGDLAKGSARSIDKYDIFEELYKCKHLFERFGGHSMAAGLSLEMKNIEPLRTLLNENCLLKEDDFVEIINIDKELSLDEITYELACELQILQPFGKENKEPLFGTLAAVPEQIRMIENKNTIIFTFLLNDSYRKIKGVCFGMVDEFKKRILAVYGEEATEKICAGVLRESNLALDLVYSIEINNFNNNVSVQIRIKDFRVVKL